MEETTTMKFSVEQDTTGDMKRELAQFYTRAEMMKMAIEFLEAVHDEGPATSSRIDLRNGYYRDLGLLTGFVRNYFPE